MLKEYFCHGSCKSLTFAYFGVVAIVGHSFWRAFIKYRLNAWYGRFYDVGGSASEVSSGDVDRLVEGQHDVTALLTEFVMIVGPGVVIHPVFNLLTNFWVLNWRVTLIKSYLERWRLDDKKIENGAQRVHEDTQRFARGIESCVIVLLDAVLTLATFTPLLLSLGSEVQPRDMPSWWLFGVCANVAGGGALVSVVCGWSLVRLEVENQKVEAELRKKLVLLEEDPGAVCGRTHSEARDLDAIEPVSDMIERPPMPQPARNRTAAPPVPQFARVLRELRANYTRLYQRFAVFRLWLTSFEQTVAVLPYLITAPLLFCDDPARRITLGKVTQLANAFGNVFSALNVLSDNWISVTDWLSVLRRLREWERHVGQGPHAATRTLIDHDVAASSTEMTERVGT